MVWACCKCIAKYRSWSQLDVHLLSHGREMVNDVKDDALWCGSCTRSVDTHCNSVDIEDIFLCAHCDQVFSDKLLIELHFKIDHREMFPQTSWFICQVCGSRLFMRLCDIRKHMQDDHCQFHFDVEPSVVSKLQDTMFPCQVCGVLCVLSKYCEQHKSSAKPSSSTLSVQTDCTNHADIPNCHSCQKCDESFDNCSTLWSHMLIDHENSEYVCNICQLVTFKGLISKPMVTRHMKIIHNINIHLPDANKYLRTQTQVVENGNVTFKCPAPMCKKTALNIGLLQLHLLSHSDEKLYSCEKCDKHFISRKVLSTHVEYVHGNVEAHVCPTCGRSYKGPRGLVIHMQIHSEEKRYVCNVCGAAFNRSEGLSSHKFMHADKKFICSICGDVFRHPASLRAHMISRHTEPQFYFCTICGKKFNRSATLKDHIAVFHGTEKSFICNVCNVAYATKKRLREHQRKLNHIAS
uniref:Zinc finger protein 573 n=1 Tax=Cacopsylla melanoneura TaxID=428564 RepID=A0A8D8UEV1_9HEMI